jgi:hypothetical protein
MRVTGGRIVQTWGKAQPYKVVLEDEGGGCIEHPVASVREGEALIRERCSPPPPARIKAMRKAPGPEETP